VKSLPISFTLLALFLLPFSGNAQSIVINEIMTSNNNQIVDEDGDHNDWIEIYNRGSIGINLYGYALSDDESNPQKWLFPNIILRPDSFLLVFASTKDRAISGQELHTNFSLGIEGEPILLTNPLGNQSDLIEPTIIAKNTSLGRMTDGTGDWYYIFHPSPGATNIEQQTPSFSHDGGFYVDEFQLNLLGSTSSDSIHFTIDGTAPTVASPVYSSSILMDETALTQPSITQIPTSYLWESPNSVQPKAITLKAQLFNNGIALGPVVTQTYFIQNNGIKKYDLPIVSIITDTTHFFNHDSGIYVSGAHYDETDPEWTGNYFEEGINWEVPAHIEFYEPNGVIGFNQNIGLRIHGGKSRGQPQKSLRIYARDEYGVDKIEHQVFPNREITEFKRLVLRSNYSWMQGSIEDYMAHQIVDELDLDNLAQRPVVVYVNGEYWGIHKIAERIDEHYIAAHHEVHKDSIDLLGNYWGHVENGSNNDYYDLFEFIEQNDLSNASNYAHVESQMEIDNFIDYQICEIFVGNFDWPANNLRMWKPQREGGKWRWIFFDLDASLQALEFNTLVFALQSGEENTPNVAASTLFFRRLLQNENFRSKFLIRFEELLNTTFNSEQTLELLDNALTLLSAEMEDHINRWNYPQSYRDWNNQILALKRFLIDRPCVIRTQVLDEFSFMMKVPDCEKSDIVLLNIHTFPNPSDGNFTVQFESTETELLTMKLANMMGQVVYHENLQSFKGQNEINVNAPGLMPGLHILTLSQGKQVFRKKVMIKQY
jgi:hypothetical protein